MSKLFFGKHLSVILSCCLFVPFAVSFAESPSVTAPEQVQEERPAIRHDLTAVTLADSGQSDNVNCSKISSLTGKLICADDTLRAENYELSSLDQVILSVSPDKPVVQRGIKNWLAERDKCKSGSCLEKVFLERRTEVTRILEELSKKGENTVAYEEYFDESEIFGDYGENQKESQGKYTACVKLNKSALITFVDFSIDFPDSGQILQARIPAVEDGKGTLNFRFVDGWYNCGKGTVKFSRDKCILNLEEETGAEDAVASNILRQYGEYSLSKVEPGTCSRRRK